MAENSIFAITFMSLSDEILIEILQFLTNSSDIIRISQVNQRLKRLAQDKSLAARLTFRQDFHLDYGGLTHFLHFRCCYLNVRHINLNSVYWLNSSKWKFLAKLRNLQELHVADTKISTADIVMLLNTLTKLEAISMTWPMERKMEVGDPTFPNIRSLSLDCRVHSGQETATASTIFSILVKFPGLKQLFSSVVIEGCDRVCGRVVILPGEKLDHIERIVHVYQSLDSGLHMFHVFSKNKTLESLPHIPRYLGSCSSVPLVQLQPQPWLLASGSDMRSLHSSRHPVTYFPSHQNQSTRLVVTGKLISQGEGEEGGASSTQSTGEDGDSWLENLSELRFSNLENVDTLSITRTQFRQLSAICLAIDCFESVSLEDCSAVFSSFVNQVRDTLTHLELIQLCGVSTADPGGLKAEKMLHQIKNLPNLAGLVIGAKFKYSGQPVFTPILTSCRLQLLHVKVLLPNPGLGRDLGEGVKKSTRLKNFKFCQKSWLSADKILLDCLGKCETLRICCLIDDTKAVLKKINPERLISLCQSCQLLEFLYVESPSLTKADAKIFKAELKKIRIQRPVFVFGAGQTSSEIVQEYSIPSCFLPNISSYIDSDNSSVANIRSDYIV